jgi:starch synthase (maltosyl-transferring)
VPTDAMYLLMPKGKEPSATAPAASGRARPVISGIRPVVDDGAFAAKGSLGEPVLVEADIFADGPDVLAAEVRFRHDGDANWETTSLRPLGNDRWRATFPVAKLGRYQFSIRAMVDEFATWRRNFVLRAATGYALALDLRVGAGLVRSALNRATGPDRRQLAEFADALEAAAVTAEAGTASDVDIATDPDLGRLMSERRSLGAAATSRTYLVDVERERARFSTWYELFPRSTSPEEDRAGTFADVEERLDYVAEMGFDVLYLPPIHPIGTTARKGRDGSSQTTPGDPGSPWAIGSRKGGHTAVHRDLGTLTDFKHLVRAAKHRGLEIALDLAFQCSPDHPWVSEHPSWFKHLPDGTIQTAENPPKRYEDVYPLDFSTPDWRQLWEELREVNEFWITQGVRIFRVDNPHTKPLRFWEWLITSLRAAYPDVIWLAEAFTRPRVMEQLAKAGFSQSYTYFTWRNSADELRDYLTELTTPPVADYFRPNLWPNTPDILHEVLQHGGKPAFALRLVLAATLSANYGIYGPPYELSVRQPREPGSEEYLHSEKFEVRHWEIESPDSLARLITSVNDIRHDHPALQHDRALRFHRFDNDLLLAYSKSLDESTGGEAGSDVVLVVVNLDPAFVREGTVFLDLGALGIDGARPFFATDLLTGAKYTWHGSANYVRLDPAVQPAHIFSIEQPGATA